MYCRNCGTEIKENANYCDKCNTPVITNKKDWKITLILGIVFLIITILLLMIPFTYRAMYIFEIILLIGTCGLVVFTDSWNNFFKYSPFFESLNFKNPIYDIVIAIFAIISIVFFVIYFRKKKKNKLTTIK